VSVRQTAGGLVASLLVALIAGLVFAGCGTSYTVRHTVEPGDTLYKIAQQHGTSVEEIRQLNQLRESDVIRVGDTLFVPGAPDPNRSQRRKADATASKNTSTAKKYDPPPKRSGGKAVLAWPVPGEVVKKYDSVGRGIDLRVPENDPVRAAAPGKVTYAGTPAPAYGSMAIVAHGGDLFTVYSQLGRLEAKGGDRVETGQLIGRASGRGAIHFEVRQGKQPRDPLLYLPRR